MHLAFIFLLLAAGTSFARYSSTYGNHNFIERAEPDHDDDIEIVECPVCENLHQWYPSKEVCSIDKDHRKYKKCEYGTYINEICGNRRDCYRGPREQCTEKMEFDVYGQRCAPGYYCSKYTGVCQGIDYVQDSNELHFLNPNHRYSMQRTALSDRAYHSLLDAINN